jgi:hypothetical protein
MTEYCAPERINKRKGRQARVNRLESSPFGDRTSIIPPSPPPAEVRPNLVKLRDSV